MTVFFFWSGQDFDFGNFLAVASAAVNTAGEVVVLVDERPARNPHFDRLAEIRNVVVEPLVPDALMSTKHAELYHRMTFVAHRSDLVGFAVLARNGGIVLDTDTLTMRPLDGLPARLLCEDGKIVHIGVMGLPAGDALAARMLEELLAMPETDLGVYQSIVYHWTRVVREAAPTMSELSRFFPVHWKEWERIFIPDGYVGDPAHIHVLHHYGHFSRAYTQHMDERWLAENPCLFSQLALPLLDRLVR